MSLPERTVELLERYPDQLTEAEISELRETAATDPKVAELLATIDALEHGRPDAPEWPEEPEGTPQLSEIGQARIERMLESAGDAPSGARAPVGRRWWVAIAAILLVGVSLLLLRPPEPDPTTDPFRGGPGDLDVTLVVLGDAPVPDGARRPVDDAVRFQVVSSGPAWLALVEVQGNRRSVLWPPPGEQWQVTAGIHLLTPTGQAPDYEPGSHGQTRYELIAAPGPLHVGESDATADGAGVASTSTIIWMPTAQP